MKNDVLEDIKAYAIKKLKEEYGYCGLADSDDMAMLNSEDRRGNDIKITIGSKPE